MPVPGLLKRASSISVRFQEELGQLRGDGENAGNQVARSADIGAIREESKEGKDGSANEQTDTHQQKGGEVFTEQAEAGDQGGQRKYLSGHAYGQDNAANAEGSDDEADDTDVVESDEDELLNQIKQAEKHTSDVEPPIRMSKRLMSLKRRGKGKIVTEEPEKFEYYAGDILTVRGEDTDFFMCRVLEDVPEDTEEFKIAWYDKVGDNIYEVSFDDKIYGASVLAHVSLLEKEDGHYELTKKSLQVTRRILRESIRAERGGKDKNLDILEDDFEEFADDEEDEEEDEAPPVKKRRKNSSSKTDTARKTRTPKKSAVLKEVKTRKKQNEQAVTRRRGLLPNPVIDIVERDPIFGTKQNIPLTPVKLGLKAVLTDDMELLKKAIADVDNVHTIFWARSPDIHYGPIEYALLDGNKEALDLMTAKNMPKERKAKRPSVSLTKMDTGTYNFYTFGHRVRDLEASRGSREGNNAFLKAEESPANSVNLSFCLKKGVSHEIIDTYCKRSDKSEQYNPIIDNIWKAVQNGHRKLAAHYIGIAVNREGFGFNFLHHEVLLLDDGPLSKFKSPSVTKKPYENKKIMPIHCACINPNPRYLQALLNAIQQYSIPDETTWKPIHYAAVCEGPGPLKFLLSRGVDPNDITKGGMTPLMLAAKHGRDENIKALMEVTFMEEATEEGEVPTEKKRVTINAKNKKTLAAIHYAAKRGHESTVRLLVAEGAKVDLQTGAGKNNFTALTYAAQKGHLDVVRALVKLGAAPDKKVRQSKTALMHATINGHYPIMSYLLNIGVNPNAMDSSLNTPIHYAAAYGWYHCLQLLLEAGANPSTPNNWKTTPLAIALMKDNVPCADLLLNMDVDVDFPDDTGCTILMHQILTEYTDTMLERIDYLVKKKGANPNKADLQGFRPMHFLASHSIYTPERSAYSSSSHRKGPRFNKRFSEVCCKVAEVLIEAGADVNAKTKEGKTALMIAICQNNFPLIELLVKHGAVASTGKEEVTLKTAIHYLLDCNSSIDLFEYFEDEYPEPDKLDQKTISRVYEEHFERATLTAMQSLIEAGADVNAKLRSGATPLLTAFDKGSLHQVDILIKSNACPFEGRNHLKQNLLHIMADHCAKYDLTDYLREINKKFDLKSSELKEEVDNNGYVPFLIACERYGGLYDEGNPRARAFIKLMVEDLQVDVFAQVGEKTSDPKASYSNKSNYSMQADEDNIKKFANYHMTGHFTCLHFMVNEVVVKDKLLGLKMMLEFTSSKKGFINTRDRHGRTPLHFALHRVAVQQAMMLISYGADVNLLSGNLCQDDNASPLYLSVRYYQLLNVASELLKNGADPNIPSNYRKRTALMHAIMRHSDDTVKLDFVDLLLKSGSDVNLRDCEGRTALHFAADATTGGYETLTEVEDLLVKFKADVSVADCFGRLPVHYAFMSVNGTLPDGLADPISIVTMLCEAAKDQNNNVSAMLQHQDKAGNTSLHLAALRGATMCCLHLIKKGASLSVKNFEGNYPISLALKGKHHGCAMACLQEGCSAACNVYWEVTQEQLRKYEKEKKAREWQFRILSKEPEAPKTVVKSAFHIAVENDWQGVAYMMLYMADLPIIDAYKAALKTNKLQLVWTLLKKQKTSEQLFAVDEKKAGLLHILATYSKQCKGGVKDCVDVAKLLIEHGLSLSVVDCDQATPLHYAAYNCDYSLCSLFIEHAPDTLNMLNKDGMNPLTAAFYSGITAGSLDESVIHLLMTKGTTKLDICFDTGHKKQNGNPETTTILNDMVLVGNMGSFTEKSNDKEKRMGCIEYFLKNGASVDFPNADGDTPIMTAVKLNSKAVVELLLTYKPDLSLQDSEGKSVVHHCVQTDAYGSCENVEMLELLAKHAAPLNIKDKAGHAPLYYAKQQGSGVMTASLKALYRKHRKGQLKDDEELMDTGERGYQFLTTPDQYWQLPQINPAEDASKELAGLNEILETSGPPPVDSALNMSDTGEVYVDPKTDIPYDVVLSKVDVKWGRYGLNTFYKLQVVHHKGKDLWLLFNRWGRVGDSGQHQRTPFTSPEEATNEFKKIFKSKTGNDWKDLENFEQKPKKYAVLNPEKNPERMLQHREEVIKDINFDECPKSKLPKSIQDFIADIADLKTIKKCIEQEKYYESSLVPFGLISRDILKKAFEVLNQIESLLNTVENRDLREHPEVPEIFSKISELSNTFFMMVPPVNYCFERIHPLNTLSDVQARKNNIRALVELSHSSMLLLGAQHKHKEINPLDYCHQALATHIELMDPSTDECQLLLEFIENSSKRTYPSYYTRDVSTNVLGIYRVQRPGVENKFSKINSTNRILLWHGTKTAHMIGILKSGLQIDAPHALKMGARFGTGIYFSTSLAKSLDYCCAYYQVSRYVLLCEVALGAICYYDSSGNDSEKRQGTDSLWVRAKKVPDPSKDITTPYGAKVQRGNIIANKEYDEAQKRQDFSYSCFRDENEVVVYDPNQVRIRYIVKIKGGG